MKKYNNKFVATMDSLSIFCLALSLISNVAIAEFMDTSVTATNLLTLDETTSHALVLSGTAISELPIGRTIFSDKPVQAKSLSMEGGIVTGQLQTGETPYTVKLQSQWLGSFRKDSSDATFQFNIIDAFLQIGNESINNTAKAEFSFAVFKTTENNRERVFYHEALISGHGGTSVSETYNIVFNDGDLTGIYREYNPFEDPSNPTDRIAVAEIAFDPFTGSVDLSDISVGSKYTMEYILDMSVTGLGIERWSTARFSDPADFESGGVTTTYAGITPVAAVVPVPAAVWLFATGLLGLLGINRRRSI